VDPVVTLPPVHSLTASGCSDKSLVLQPPALLSLENTDITAWSTGTTGLVELETGPPALPHRLAAEFKSGFYVPVHTVVTLLLHCGHTVVTLLLHCCYTVVTLLLHCCFTVVTLPIGRGGGVGGW
jgi:hypothetical protein